MGHEIRGLVVNDRRAAFVLEKHLAAIVDRGCPERNDFELIAEIVRGDGLENLRID